MYNGEMEVIEMAQVITKITRQKRNEERYNIFLDEKYAFSVDESIIIQYGLTKGKILDEMVVGEITFDDEVSKAYNRGLSYLSFQMRSEHEIQQKLLKEEYGEAVIAEAIQKLIRIGLLDDQMYSKALEYANLSGDEIVYDLYCGIGTISLLLAQKCKKVYGIEVVKQAIKSAKENAIINNISNAHFICGKVEDKIQDLLNNSQNPDIVILDPARKGCEETALKTILNAKPKKIIYISCNPSTLARDLKILLETKDYILQEVTPYDLFCHTMHIENVVLLERL